MFNYRSYFEVFIPWSNNIQLFSSIRKDYQVKAYNLRQVVLTLAMLRKKPEGQLVFVAQSETLLSSLFYAVRFGK